MSISKEEVIKEIMEKKGITELWPVQEMALEKGLLDEDRNFIIIAPTASGKTLTAEFTCYKCLKEGGRILYLVPTNSLINNKEDDFKYLKEEYNIAGIGASPSDWNDCDIMITSFEAFYQTALLNTSLAEGFNLAIIDEFHILYDKLRGFTLEKIMTLLKILGIRILCLSATFEDKNEIGDWLDAQVIDIPNDLRRVPLIHNILELTTIEDLFNELNSRNLGPYIIFCSTRDYCKSRAINFSTQITNLVKPTSEIFDDIKKIINRQNLTSLEQDLSQCLSKGVGFHHSGLDSRIKNYVEDLFLTKHIKYLFATTGLAYGMNLPARSVVLCDLQIYDTLKRIPSRIPVYLYLQMAGRAGRPQFGDDGYAFVVVKNRADAVFAGKFYLGGLLKKAISHIAEDAYFRKAILELIYSGRRRSEEISIFFENTFYNYQSVHITSPFSDYNLMAIIRNHIIFLENNNFIQFLGAPGYQLTELGRATIEFLFRTYSTYDLEVFLELENYLDTIEELRDDFDIILTISNLFRGSSLSKIPRENVEEIDRFYEERGVEEISHAEYSSYAIWNGWIENMSEEIIEDRFKVYTSSIEQVARELFSLLTFTETLAKIKDIPVSDTYENFKQRIRRGYREEELPFIGLRYFGRVLLRNLYNYCYSVLTRPPWNCKGTMLQILTQFRGLVSLEDFINALSGIELYSRIRAKRIYDFIEKY